MVEQRLGKPVDKIAKGRNRFVVKMMNMMFYKDHIYTTAFYDKHNKNNLTGLLQVSESMENRLQKQYGAPSTTLEKALNIKTLI